MIRQWLRRFQWFQRYELHRKLLIRYRELQRQREFEQAEKDAGFIQSRPLSQHDTVECCNWVLANCPRSLATRMGQSSQSIAHHTRFIAEERIKKAFAEGLTREDDWAVSPIRFVLEDRSERALFKLTWC